MLACLYVGDEPTTPSKKVKKEKSTSSSPSKSTGPVYHLPKEERDLIRKDSVNKKLWDELLKGQEEDFLKRVEETFLCICCQDLVYLPVSTVCKHYVCKVG